MEHKDSLPHLQEPPNCPSPEPDQSSPCPQSYSLRIHLNIILTFTPGTSKCYLSPNFSTKTLRAHFLFPIRATCSAKLTILDSITRIIFGEDYKSLSISIFLHTYFTSSLVDPYIFLSTLSSSTLSLSSSLNESDKFRNLIKHI
jgi:hypothetical protein